MNSLRIPTVLLAVLLGSLPSAAGAALPTFGTPRLIEDLEPGPADSTIRFLLPTPSHVVFEREPLPYGSPPELWATDGTPGQAFRLQPPGLEIPIAPVIWHTEQLIYFDGMDAATKTRSIWRTDGTLAGTVELADHLRFGIRSRALDDRGLFLFVAGAPEADYGDIDWELWVSDGTPGGTRRIRDYVQQPNGESSFLVAYDGDGYFLDQDPTDPAEIGLWHTDGTAAGTERIFDAPGIDFRRLWATGDGLYLLGRDQADSGTSLWISHGTAASTHLVKTLGDPVGLAEPAHPLGTLSGRTLWTLFSRSISPSVWVSDGTAAGTEPILDLALNSFERPDIGSSIVPYRGLGYFVADDGEHGRTLWRTDGTADGTAVVLETGPEGSSVVQTAFFPLKDLLFVERSDLAHGAEPGVSDGTASGTRLLGDLCPGPCSSSPVGFNEVPGGAIFLAEGADSEFQLWASDLTAPGTRQITQPLSFPGGIENSPPILLWNDRVFFVGDNAHRGKELYSLPFSGGSDEPAPPPGPWLRSSNVPGFEAKVRITPQGGAPVAGSARARLHPGDRSASRVPCPAARRSSSGSSARSPTATSGRPWSSSRPPRWRSGSASSRPAIIRYYLLEGASPGIRRAAGPVRPDGLRAVGHDSSHSTRRAVRPGP